jgi:hypothetical protein
MAVTRIKNNQITDASIVASTKLVNNSVTAGKLEDNLTYGSNLTITGNLTVNGATSTVSTTNTTVEDTVMVLNSDASGSNTTDVGIYGERGSDASVFMGWDESEDEFAFITTSSAGSDTAMTVTDYADLRLGGLTADDAITATGNVTGGNLNTGAQVVATGNITGGNLLTAGLVQTGDLTVLASGTIEMNENVVGNIGTPVAATDAATKGYVDTALSSVFTITDGTNNQSIADGDTLTFAGTANEVTVAVSATDTVTIGLPDDVTIAGNLTVNGTTTTVNSATLDVADLNITIADGAADSSAANGAGITVDGAGATILYTHATTSWDFNKPVNVTGAFDATANVSGGNIISDAQMVATGNITGANILTGGLIDATGNIDGANLNTAGKVVAGGDIEGQEITIAGSDITTDQSELTVNDAGADVNFRVEGDTNANLIFVDAGTDSVNIGTATTTTDVTFKVGTTDAAIIPTGTTAQRPATGVVGMLRWNTTLDSLEQFSSVDGWEAVGAPAFTVIASETFDGDNSTVAFTLSDSQTTASCIVSINGVVQLPTTAYGVSGTTLTFTEAPLAGDKIEVRKVTTTTTLTNLTSTSGGTHFKVDSETEAEVKGNLMPSADSTYSIGNSTVRWTDIYVDAGSIHLGDVILKESGGTLQVFGSDGTTPADTAVASITKSGSDGVGNIGQSDNAFNTVFAEATSAQYADLAEKYEADAEYEPGTVVHFGGEKEVSQCDMDHCTRVAGVVSTAPAYRMNDGLEAEHTAMVALTGRVPCKVQGPVAKGDMMVSAGNGKARAETDPKVGAVIGKALEDFNGEEGVIEVVVGKH